MEQFESRFFALSIDMLCIARFSGHFIRLNPAWEVTLGYTIADLQSRRMFEFVHPEDLERTLEQNRRVREGGRALSFQNRYRHKDGSYRWLRWNAQSDVENELIYSIARDVTEAKRAEEERERLIVELRETLAEVTELRTILPICSYCRRVRDDENYWHSVEAYLSHHTKTSYSHGICPSCYETVVEPQFRESEEGS